MEKESTYDKIKRISGMHESACSCQQCRNMCAAMPCLGTPEDILKLVDAGYADQLSPTIWAVGMVFGISGPIAMVQPKRTHAGCIFYKAGMCLLHDRGLKPTEGKLAGHEGSYMNRTNITYLTAKEWEDNKHIDTIVKIMEKIV